MTGIEIYDATGKLQFNGDMLTYALRVSGTATVAAYKVGNTCPNSLSVPTTQTYSSALVALGGGGGYGAAYYGSNSNTNQRLYATNAPVGTTFNYYVYDRSNNIPANNFGLEVRNAAGQITFSSNQRTMRVPTILGSPNDINSPSYTASGHTLAFCQGAFAGHRIAGSIASADSANGPWNLESGGRYHRYAQDGKVYGACVTNGGATVTATPISYDDVTIGPYTGDAPPIDYEWPLTMFVVDVTGVPIGQTFF